MPKSISCLYNWKISEGGTFISEDSNLELIVNQNNIFPKIQKIPL